MNNLALYVAKGQLLLQNLMLREDTTTEVGGEPGTNYTDFLTKENGATNAGIDGLTGIVESLLRSLFKLGVVAGIGLIIFALLLAFVAVGFGSQQGRTQGKSNILWGLVAIAGITGIVGIVNLVAGISNAMFSAGTAEAGLILWNMFM